jgi:hypothetical protein
MVPYKTGYQLDIVGGIYKKYKHATFLRYSGTGTKMCDVKVHHDIAMERRVRLTSIKKAATAKNDDEVVVMTKKQYNELLDDIKALSDAVALLELKARRYR